MGVCVSVAYPFPVIPSSSACIEEDRSEEYRTVTHTSLLTNTTLAVRRTCMTSGHSQKSASTTFIGPPPSPHILNRFSASASWSRAREEAWGMFSKP